MEKTSTKRDYVVSEVLSDNYAGLKAITVEFVEGLTIEVLNLGGIIRQLELPDQNGLKQNVVLNYGSIHRYYQDNAYLGCLVGRYANRIRNGFFKLEGKEFQLPCNHGSHHLHGGHSGFNQQIWEVMDIQKLDAKVIIQFSHQSPDGDQGYPGNLTVNVDYIISQDSLEIVYSAESDKTTIFNPTHHGYFNLSGDLQSCIDDHFLQMEASRFVETDGDLLPTGSLQNVSGSANDFRTGELIGDRQFDTCFELDGGVLLKHDASGRTMRISTSFPGVQLYTGDYLHKAGLKNRAGLCLETQFFPDSPNHPHFPSTTMLQTETFQQKVVYDFEW